MAVKKDLKLNDKKAEKDQLKKSKEEKEQLKKPDEEKEQLKKPEEETQPEDEAVEGDDQPEPKPAGKAKAKAQAKGKAKGKALPKPVPKKKPNTEKPHEETEKKKTDVKGMALAIAEYVKKEEEEPEKPAEDEEKRDKLKAMAFKNRWSDLPETMQNQFNSLKTRKDKTRYINSCLEKRGRGWEIVLSNPELHCTRERVDETGQRRGCLGVPYSKMLADFHFNEPELKKACSTQVLQELP